MKYKIIYLVIWVALLLLTSCDFGEKRETTMSSYDTLGRQMVGCCVVIYKIRVDDKIYLVHSKGGIVLHQTYGYR